MKTKRQIRPELYHRGFLERGSEYWETRDGMFRLVKSQWCDGIELPVEWKVWQWRHGTWSLVGEFRSRKRAITEIATRQTLLESGE